MNLSQIKLQNLKGLLEPVAEFLRKNCHPHDTLIVTNNAYELLHGLGGGDLGPIKRQLTNPTNDSNRTIEPPEPNVGSGQN